MAMGIAVGTVVKHLHYLTKKDLVAWDTPDAYSRRHARRRFTEAGLLWLRKMDGVAIPHVRRVGARSLLENQS